MATRTDSAGFFRFAPLPYDRYRIQVFAYGYRPLQRTVRLDTGKVHVELELDTSSREMKVVEIGGRSVEEGERHLRAIEDMGIYAAKKSSVVLPEESGADRSSNNARELFSSVAGVVAHEEGDGGLQMAIGNRGLNPKRSAHFNMRQNGHDMSADALGYPEAYYTPPAQAVERIEVVRGASSLQYGPQFGGMVNFQLEGPPEEEGLRAESHQTLGSFDFFNSYTELGGRKGGTAFQGFFQERRGDGWRPNAEFQQRTAYLEWEQRLSENTRIGLQLTHMDLLKHQPGGLTDRAFLEDPSRSLRERNWFSVGWNMGALSLEHEPGPRSRIESRLFGLMGSRDAVGVLERIDRADHGGERLLLKDEYRNIGNETRYLQYYDLFEKKSALLLGGRYYQGRTFRRQGPGSTGKGPDFAYPSDKRIDSKFHFPSRNIALFAENLFRVGERWTITPGVRFEGIRTASKGWFRQENRDLAGNILYQERIEEERVDERSFFLYGLGIAYRLNEGAELYANYSRNYRGIGFNDMRLLNPNFKVDPQLSDESGYTADLGVRGNFFEHLRIDLSVFTLYYSDRIGTVLKVDSNDLNTFRLRTNIADSRTLGVESYLELELMEWIDEDAAWSLQPFLNLTRQKAFYLRSEEAAFEGKRVEMAPAWNSTSGLKGAYEGLEWRYQFRYVSYQYADATNAKRVPSADVGLIPAYSVSDASISYGKGPIRLRAGVHNLFDRSYFTHRAKGYGGPGIVPAPPRNYYLTLSLNFGSIGDEE